MDLDQEIIAQLMATFTVEAEEHVKAINNKLLSLEKKGGGPQAAAALEELFREAHSLKGAARAVDLLVIEELAHGMENVFSGMRKKELALSAELFDLLYRSADIISSLIRAGADISEHQRKLSRTALEILQCASQGKPIGESLALLVEKQHEQAEMEEDVEDASADSRKSAQETIRVSTRKLDALMTHVEELLVYRIRTEQRLSDLKGLKNDVALWQKSWLKIKGAADKLPSGGKTGSSETDFGALAKFLGANDSRLKSLSAKLGRLVQEFDRDNLRMSLITDDLQHDIRKVRMLPVSTIFSGFERVVRDVARQSGKEVVLRVFGSATELDKKVLEGVKDPIMHILRNCVDHGVETPAKRVAAGKPTQGTVVLRAMHQGGRILIEIEDDGAGIDVDKVRSKAIESGMITAADAKALTDKEIMFLIFRSGFSTADAVSNVSGRGVGLDVVRKNIEALKGMIEIDSTRGSGTKFSIILPLTLSTSRVLLAKASEETFAIPTSAIERILRIGPSQIHAAGNKQAVIIDGRPVSLVRLDEVLELPPGDLAQAGSGRIPVIVLGAAEKRVAFAVEALVGETEVVVKSLSKKLSRVRNVSGATILGTGKVVMILNVSDLLKSARFREKSVELFRAKPIEKTERKATIMVVDDSITTRTLEKNILEAAGFTVRTAKDGLEAWELLKRQPCDLVVSDVDMPRMSGLDLTAKVRADQKLKDRPVVLVTAMESAADRERGIEVGADAYIVKSHFDQKNLLQTIEQLI